MIACNPGPAIDNIATAPLVYRRAVERRVAVHILHIGYSFQITLYLTKDKHDWSIDIYDPKQRCDSVRILSERS